MKPDQETHFLKNLCMADTDRTGEVSYEEAKIYMNARRYNDARVSFEKALPYAKNDETKLAVRCGLGFVKYKMGDFPEALREFRKSIILAEHTGNLHVKAWILEKVGIIYRSTGRTKESLDHLGKSFAILGKVGTRHHRIDVQAEMAMGYLYRGDFARAAKLNSRSLLYHLLLGLGDGIAPGMNNGAVLYIHKRKYRIALLMLYASEIVATKQGDQKGLATTFHNMGNCYTHLDKHDLAEKTYRESMRISRENLFSDIEGASNFCLASLSLKRGDLEDAFVSAQLSELISRRIGSKEFEAKGLEILGEISRRRGDPNKAILSHKRGLTVAMVGLETQLPSPPQASQ